MNAEECQQQLLEITQRLNPVLTSLGYVFKASGSGMASGGPFAAGFYVNGEKKIGLIYRAIAGLGCVNYEFGQLMVSHDDLMRFLGKASLSKLKYDKSKFSSYSKDKGNVVESFVYDVQNLAREFLISSDEQFGKMLRDISRAHDNQPPSHVMTGIILGMVVGVAIGFMLQSLGWGVFLGFILGLGGGIYWDLKRQNTA